MRFDRRNMLKMVAGSAVLLGSGLQCGNIFAQDKKIKIGFSQATMNHPWRVAMVNVNKAYADEHLKDVDLVITDGNNSSGKQVSDVENLVSQGINVLMISPLTADALTPVVKQTMEAGIPVLTLDRSVNTPVTSHIGARNLPIGAQAAAFLNTRLGGNGAIVELQGSAGASATVDRINGFADELSKYPGLKIVAAQDCDYLQEKALKFMEDVLQRFGPGEIQAIYAHADEMAYSAVQLLEEAGRLNEIAIVGINGANQAIEFVNSGKMAATFTYPFVAPEGVQYAYKIAKGETIPKEVVLESVAITKENAGSMIGKGY